ncbi:tigger transposable element-derived protein 6 [Ceratobasidium sp. AG-Ba]|nr:tigger transposable element-derived protein 6 [Ceratobasidium sp. AG-Ba]
MSPHRHSGAMSKMERAQSIAQHSLRQNMTYSQKIEVLDFYHRHKNYVPLCKMPERLHKEGLPMVHYTTIRRLVNNEQRVRQYVSEHPKCLDSKRETVVTHPELEEALARWVEQQLNANLRLTGYALVEKAQRLCKLFSIPTEDRIKFSNGWLESFKRRHGLHRITFHGERASAPTETIAAERARLRSILAAYSPRDQYNMDETAVYGSLPPSAGLGTHDTGGLKPNRDRLTAALCGNAEGTHKLPVIFIGRAACPQSFSRYRTPREMGYWYFNNPTAWMNYEIFKEFLSDLNDAMRLENRYILLLCDNASSHKPPKKGKDDFSTLFPHVRVEYLSPNLTPWVQPLDAGIIKSFKSQYQRRYVQLTLERSEEGRSNPYKLNQREVMEMATAAWSSVSTTTIRNCWAHTGIVSPPSNDPTEPAIVYYPEDDPASVAGDIALELGLNPERTDPAVYDLLEALALDHPTEETPTIEQIYEEMQSSS